MVFLSSVKKNRDNKPESPKPSPSSVLKRSLVKQSSSISDKSSKSDKS
jgi:hypothetical protein